MSDPVSHLKRELLAAAERQQADAVPARKSRRRWFERSDGKQGHRRRRVFALVAAVLVVAVGTASAIGSVRNFIVDRGFIGLPPVGATPSAPEGGELVLHYIGRSVTHAGPPTGAGPAMRVWVYADGRMIWDREGTVPAGANEFESGFLEQRLTEDGVELLRSELVASGLFDRSLTLLLPWNYSCTTTGLPCVWWLHAEVRRGDRLVRLRLDNSDLERTATPEQVSALRRVDVLFTDPVSVLPSSAWADRDVRAYVPSHYAVCIGASPPTDASRLLSLLPTRAEELLRDEIRTRVEDDVVEGLGGGRTKVLGRAVTYCSKVATDEGRELAEALSGLDRDPWRKRRTLAYRVAEGANDYGWHTAIWFEPYLPHGGLPRGGR
jgi:hypothetical protein